jgi:hypothetical protein
LEKPIHGRKQSRGKKTIDSVVMARRRLKKASPKTTTLVVRELRLFRRHSEFGSTSVARDGALCWTNKEFSKVVRMEVV